MEEYTTPAILLTVKQVMRLLNLGRSKVEALIKHEGLPVLRIGRAVRIPYGPLLQWIDDFQRKQSVEQ